VKQNKDDKMSSYNDCKICGSTDFNDCDLQIHAKTKIDKLNEIINQLKKDLKEIEKM
jgi:hypothetical protein